MPNSNCKIQNISTYFYPVLAGSETNLLYVSSILANRGWEEIVYTTKDTPSNSGSLKDFEEYKGIKIRRYSNLSFCFYPFSLGIDYKSNGIICFNDFITFPDLFICFYTWMLKILGIKKYKLVFSAMGLFNYDTKIYPGLKFRLKQAIDHTIGVWFINHSVDAIQAISEAEKNGLIKGGINPDLITIIPCGVENEAYSSDIDNQASPKVKQDVKGFGKYILQVARINRIKNMETAIKALAGVPLDVKLVFAGQVHNSEYKEELLKLAESLGLKNRVVFLGEVPTFDKYYLMKNAECLVHMSKSEGFGIVILEAMSQGAVCLISEGTAMDELIQEGINGFRFKYDDSEALSKKMKYIVENKESADIVRMKNNNTTFANERSWEEITNKLEGYYKSLLEGSECTNHAT